MNLDIDSIVGKIEHNVDKIGMVVGGYSYLKKMAEEWRRYGSEGDPLKAGTMILEALLANPHIPNLGHAFGAMKRTGIMDLAKYVIGAYLLKEVDLTPETNRIGNAVMKGGIGAIKANALLALLTYSGAGASEVKVGSSFGGAIQTNDSSVRGL